MLIDRGFMRNFFNLNIKDATRRQVDGLRMHKIAFEEMFDPSSIFADAENDAGSLLYARDDPVACP
jgi:hypothetical protein